MRKALGDALVTDEGGVGLAADKIAATPRNSRRLLEARDSNSLRRACDPYGGDFVNSFTNLSPEFDDWAALERTRLRDKFLDAIETLSRVDLEAGHTEQALAAAQRLLSHDPANEAGCRAAMTALARLGRRSAALRQFEASKAALARALDTAPAQETLDLRSKSSRCQLARRSISQREPALGSAAPPPRREAARDPAARRRVAWPALAGCRLFIAWRWLGGDGGNTRRSPHARRRSGCRAAARRWLRCFPCRTLAVTRGSRFRRRHQRADCGHAGRNPGAGRQTGPARARLRRRRRHRRSPRNLAPPICLRLRPTSKAAACR